MRQSDPFVWFFLVSIRMKITLIIRCFWYQAITWEVVVVIDEDGRCFIRPSLWRASEWMNTETGYRVEASASNFGAAEELRGG